MTWRAVAGAGALLLAASSLTGCSAFGDTSVGIDDGVQVAAAFYPLQYVAERVAGGHAEVQTLTAPGQEPHDLELTPRETADVALADLVVYQRGFQPAVDDAVDQNAEGDVLDVSKVVDLVPFRDHGVDSDELDPHFWLDPLLLAQVGDSVAARLGTVDPAHAADYDANAAGLRADLEQVDAEFTSGLRGCARDTIVVTHDAFGYWQRYGLTMESIVGLAPDAEATPADLARLQRLVEDEGITTIFSEELVSPKQAERLAADTGVKAAVLDPIEGLSDETADQDYLSLMRSNLAALEEANGC